MTKNEIVNAVERYVEVRKNMLSRLLARDGCSYSVVGYDFKNEVIAVISFAHVYLNLPDEVWERLKDDYFQFDKEMYMSSNK